MGLFFDFDVIISIQSVLPGEEKKGMIYLITGPSGVGKTDFCFSLLVKKENSVYFDSDWYSAKNLITAHSPERIAEVYELLKMNIRYQIDKSVDHFFIAVYLGAAAEYRKFREMFTGFGKPVKLVLHAGSGGAIEERINSRDRIEEQKKGEINRIPAEFEQVEGMTADSCFDLITNTDGKSAMQIAEEIIAGFSGS